MGNLISKLHEIPRLRELKGEIARGFFCMSENDLSSTQPKDLVDVPFCLFLYKRVYIYIVISIWKHLPLQPVHCLLIPNKKPLVSPWPSPPHLVRKLRRSSSIVVELPQKKKPTNPDHGRKHLDLAFCSRCVFFFVGGWVFIVCVWWVGWTIGRNGIGFKRFFFYLRGRFQSGKSCRLYKNSANMSVSFSFPHAFWVKYSNLILLLLLPAVQHFLPAWRLRPSTPRMCTMSSRSIDFNISMHELSMAWALDANENSNLTMSE